MNDQNDTNQGMKEQNIQELKQDQQTNQRKKFIKNEQTSFDYNKAILVQIKTIFKEAWDKLRNFQSFAKVDLQEEDMENKEVINKMIEEILEQINSIQKKLTETIFKNSSLFQIQNPPYEQIQHHQVEGQPEIIKQLEPNIQEKQEQITPQSLVKDKDEMNKNVGKLNSLQKINKQEVYQTLNENQKFNHSQIQGYQQEHYNLILKYQLQQSIKTNINQQFECLQNKRIKIKDLTNLSNRNLFELLLSQQLEKIFKLKIKYRYKFVKIAFVILNALQKKMIENLIIKIQNLIVQFVKNLQYYDY
ncbi:unnamed protein product [Paramecium pentaurelia]|uniref:Uncharacterized protein n=1 Tax=Paramecium pentaurelia TaxID=43138 RepID=A0A8S1SAL0_9CILI|nr:unnamed protein product [Paramecium pentaurelia]